MSRSFVRLVVGSVLLMWAIGFAVMVAYSLTREWTEDSARGDGVFLAYELLEREPAAQRIERVEELRDHFHVPLAVISSEELERHVGRVGQPGETIHHAESPRSHWYFAVFENGSALAAGPKHPAIPAGAFPLGAILGIFLLPVIAGLIAVRIERQLNKVERATQALATGQLSARVDNEDGPSKELAASFNAMAERVERLIRSRDELVQAVSHELGSPLSRLRFHMELLQKDSEMPPRDRLAAMARELDALDELVAELLGYVQSDELELDRREFDPERSLTDLAELATLDVDEAVDVDLSIPARARVVADPRLFQRAVENVLRNAVRHAKTGVRLELVQSADQVCVSVHDDGPGIPEDLREKVKVPFFRLEADRGRDTGGVGLGLAIVSRIMRRHGGTLEIGSSPLGGATVTTTWPL